MSKKLPKISLRAQEIPFSPIRKFVPLLEKLKKKGIKVYELHIGQPDLPTPSQVLKNIKNVKEKILRYTPSAGIPKVRIAWQKYYKNQGINFKPSEIIVTIGGSEAIFFAFAAICNPNDEVLVPEPFYTNYNGFATIANVKLKPLTTLAKTSFHLPSKGKIEKQITKRTKAILICNPNNPTGTVYTKKELKTITDVAQKYNLFVLSDEVYREFVYDGKKHYSIMSFPQIRSQAILLDSVSKRFSACGVRIGCLATKNKEVLEAVNKFSQARLSLPMIEQLATIDILQNSKKYTRKIVREYKRRRDAVFEQLQKIEGIKCLKPKGAFYITVKLPVKDAEDFTRWLLTEFSYNEKTVMVAPAAGFYATPGLGRDEIRIAFVLSSSKLKQAMNIFKIALKEYKNV